MTIDVRDLEAGYGTRVVLEHVTATARPGRVTALVGPNAAGKSTLLRSLAGALRPRGGTVLVDDAHAWRMRGAVLARAIAWVPQGTDVAALFTVREVVALGRYRLSAAPERIDAAIERLDLTDVADRPVPELSAGQQQRVALARSVAQLDPTGHWLLDEPTSALDLRHVRDVLRLLREAAAGGATVVVALHDLASAAEVADDAWLLDGGRLVADGPAMDVLDPSRLRSVFGVDFAWVTTAGGRRIPVPSASVRVLDADPSDPAVSG